MWRDKRNPKHLSWNRKLILSDTNWRLPMTRLCDKNWTGSGMNVLTRSVGCVESRAQNFPLISSWRLQLLHSECFIQSPFGFLTDTVGQNLLCIRQTGHHRWGWSDEKGRLCNRCLWLLHNRHVHKNLTSCTHTHTRCTTSQTHHTHAHRRNTVVLREQPRLWNTWRVMTIRAVLSLLWPKLQRQENVR